MSGMEYIILFMHVIILCVCLYYLVYMFVMYLCFGPKYGSCWP
jgi:hypothetical protein